MSAERLDPPTMTDAADRSPHLERYHWAREQVRGDHVLDIACGAGHGSAILSGARSRPRVLGVDRSIEAIEAAKEQHGSGLTSFRCIEDAEAFDPPERFDTVVSLEVIEHVAHPLRFLRRMHALLRPYGGLIVSAPVAERPGDGPAHLHGFTRETLRATLLEGFEIEAALDQGDHLTVAARRRTAPLPSWEAQPTDAAGSGRLSVIVVTHNDLPAVLDLVSALRAFTTPPYELLLVDNASTDGTQSYLRLFAGEPGVRVVLRAENKKLSVALNQAIEMTKGEFVVYVCSRHGLVTESGWNDRLLRYMDEHPEVEFAGDTWNPYGFMHQSRLYANGWTPEKIGADKVLHVQGGAWVARRRLFCEVGGFNAEEYPHGGADVEFSYRLLSLGKQLGRHPAIHSPRWPEVPPLSRETALYHGAIDHLRRHVRALIGRTSRTSPDASLRGWRAVGAGVHGVADRRFVVLGNDARAGLLSEKAYEDVRIEGTFLRRGEALIVETHAGADPSSPSYRLILGAGGLGELRRGRELLGTFAAPEDRGRFSLEVRAGVLHVEINGEHSLKAEDPSPLPAGHLLVGALRGECVFDDMTLTELTGGATSAPKVGGVARPVAVVHCEWIDNESFCASIIQALSGFYDVRVYGPGWPAHSLADVDTSGARLFLELDAASGNFVHERGLGALEIPKFAWFVDTHKKPAFHAEIARDFSMTFHATREWGHVLPGEKAWLPLHANDEIFGPREVDRDIDIAFVGSQTWRADAIVSIGRRHGLKVCVESTVGPREKTRTAEIYSRAKLIFNRHVTNDLNFRVFEALAAGRVLLTDAQGNGQYELFEDGEHYVLYKDDRDLERLVVDLLGDDARRARIEREAATISKLHTTKARVAQLVQAMEAWIARRAEGLARPRLRSRPQPAEKRRRWLVVACDSPSSATMLTYAERLGAGLVERGHRVVVTRRRRGVLPGRRAASPVATIELDEGPLPEVESPACRSLLGSAAVQIQLEKLAHAHGPFDAVLVDGGISSAWSAFLAQRHDLPMVLALEACQVELRGNKLTREQLYLAELEHWLADRAAGVVVSRPDHVSGIVNHYRSKEVRFVAGLPPRPDVPAAGAERLLGRLGITRGEYSVFLGPDNAAVVAPPHDAQRTWILLGKGAWLESAGKQRQLCREPLRGMALAALMAHARDVHAESPYDVRLLEAAALGARTAGNAASGSEDLSALERLVERSRRPMSAVNYKTSRVAIFAHYDAAGEVGERTLRHIEALSAIASEVVLVSNSPIDPAGIAALQGRGARVIVRENQGYDFAMWKCAIDGLDLSRWDELVLANSSVLAPLAPLTAAFERMADAETDFWGMTESTEFAWHIQSYFLVLRKAVLRSRLFQEFWAAFVPRDKWETILGYEIGLSQKLLAAGFKGRSLAGDLGAGNPVTRRPLEVLNAGVPFVKVDVVRRNPARINLVPVLERLKQSGAVDVPPSEAGTSGRPLVSVLIAAYNPRYFEIALRSALAQTYRNIEVVIGDDCPGNEIGTIVARYRHDSRIRYFRNEPGPLGPGENHLQCFVRACGEIIKFLNDDDVLHPSCIDRMEACLHSMPSATLVTSHRQVIDRNGAFLPDNPATYRPVSQDCVIKGSAAAQSMIERRLNFIGEPSTTLFRRRDVLDLKPHMFSFCGREYFFNGDVALWLSLLARGDLVYLVDTLSYFRTHSEQMQAQPLAFERGDADWAQVRHDALANRVFEAAPTTIARRYPLTQPEEDRADALL